MQDSEHEEWLKDERARKEARAHTAKKPSPNDDEYFENRKKMYANIEQAEEQRKRSDDYDS